MNYEEADDETLVRYLRKHPTDQLGWEVLLARFDRLIWFWMREKDHEAARDLHQDIQFAIWDGLLNRYEGKGTVLSYIGSIIVNQVRGRNGMQAREHLREFYDDAQEEADSAPDATERATRKEAAAQLKSLLKQLRPKERKMLILRYFGHRHKEIIRMLRIRSVAASRKFLCKLVKKVAQLCQNRDIEPDQFKVGMDTLCEEGKLHEMLNC